MQKNVILEVSNLYKSFGGLMATNNVGLTVSEGEIIGLIGPNGSGKTTLLNLVTGMLKPNRGKICFKGERIDGLKPYRLCHMGIGRTFQITNLFLGMTVLENVMVGSLFGKKKSNSRLNGQKEAHQILQILGLWEKRDSIASSLTLQEKKQLEISRALATRPQLLLLDEVMAGLNPTETIEMIDVIKEINRSGVTLIIVEHVMNVIMTLSDRVIVLHHGEVIGEGPPDVIVKDKAVIQSYLGKEYSFA